MAGIVFICAVLLRDILKFVDERYERKLVSNPDPEHVSRILKFRRRISLYQIIASVLFCLPFIYLQIFERGILRYTPGTDKLHFVLKNGIFTVSIFSASAIISGLFLRVFRQFSRIGRD